MDQKIICKVMLYSYKYLIKKCEAVDEEIMKCGLVSFHTGIYSSFDKIVKLMNEKIAYCNIKVMVDKTLAEMKNKEAIEKYHILGISLKDLVNDFNSERTMFRHLEKQREEFCKRLLAKNDEKKLVEIISDSKWLIYLYNEILKLKKQKG